MMAPEILTIGHSNHPIEMFLTLLRDHRVEGVVDTRSYPNSKFSPHYGADELRRVLHQQGIEYIPMGSNLGGRPDGSQFYDGEGHVLYARVAEAPFFLAVLERLEKGIQRLRLALLCSEENPSVCHRHLLISRVLRQRGISISHIRADGTLQSEEELCAAEDALSSAGPQIPLFEYTKAPEWKSIPSVSRKRAPRSSSAY
jgi:uncharacterized protein (DUF488 family)